MNLNHRVHFMSSKRGIYMNHCSHFKVHLDVILQISLQKYDIVHTLIISNLDVSFELSLYKMSLSTNS